ncbi:expressed unknown protein [Seminavis robusta]|uniref:WW domain-containing protein n=1 Tax=Seminavis robusta TaxID=568900 RepID=A0A9N8HDT6_9STRA|nr:expressed unknown protein [Seminavis robusta]|eukprot:Sro441_g143710.1 n/a (339) ;mRNA; r:42581-43597
MATTTERTESPTEQQTGAVAQRLEGEKEKYRLIVSLNDEEKLHEGFNTLWQTAAVVAALFLSFLVGQSSASLDLHPNNVWKKLDPNNPSENSAEEWVKSFYDLLIGFSTVLATFMVCVTILLSNQLAHVPKEYTSKLIEALGIAVVQMSQGIILFVLVVLFLTAVGLQFSLIYSVWVASFTILSVILAGGALGFCTHYVIAKKRMVLEEIEQEKLKEQQQKQQNAPKTVQVVPSPPNQQKGQSVVIATNGKHQQQQQRATPRRKSTTDAKRAPQQTKTKNETHRKSLPLQPPRAIPKQENSQKVDLPPGWTRHFDDDTNHYYYANKATGETTWDKPNI